ncbi:MAG TPA: VWA domain-containing protein [Pyrinomonadaceae bacterium]|nr:VWA domain-containing protein [Pyrinomonadaceae bacterium]
MNVRAQNNDAQPQPTPPGDVVETLHVDTDLVNLNVSVISRNSSAETGALRQEDFTVYENGQPQEISFFASAEAPFDLVLLLDLSGSTENKLSLVKKSARRFVEASRPGDRIAIVTFTDVPVLVSRLTTDRDALKKRISKIERPRGGTNFWDALDYVLRAVVDRETQHVRRTAIIAMTDGVDNALPDVPGAGSGTSFDELLKTIRNSDAIVLPVYLDTEREMVKQHRVLPSAYALARQQLAQLAEESGSLLYQARRLEDLKRVYEQVIHNLGMVYSIGYRPTNSQRDGTWRDVAVSIKQRPELQARAKRGYFAR